MNLELNYFSTATCHCPCAQPSHMFLVHEYRFAAAPLVSSSLEGLFSLGSWLSLPNLLLAPSIVYEFPEHLVTLAMRLWN